MRVYKVTDMNHKKIIAIVALLFLMIGVCGCMSETTKATKAEQYKSSALAYLNERYDDEFAAKGFSDSSWAYDYASVTFLSKQYGKEFEVRITEQDEKMTFIDNYYQLSMNGDAVHFFDMIGESVDATTRVRFQAHVWSCDIGDAVTFADYVSAGICNMDVFFLCKNSLDENTAKTIAQEIAKNKISGTYTFYTMKAAPISSELELDEILNNYSKYVDSEMVFSINADFEIE